MQCGDKDVTGWRINAQMLEDLSSTTGKGISVLCIHDGFIVPYLDLPGFCGERLAHLPRLSLEGDGALEAGR